MAGHKRTRRVPAQHRMHGIRHKPREQAIRLFQHVPGQGSAGHRAHQKHLAGGAFGQHNLMRVAQEMHIGHTPDRHGTRHTWKTFQMQRCDQNLSRAAQAFGDAALHQYPMLARQPQHPLRAARA